MLPFALSYATPKEVEATEIVVMNELVEPDITAIVLVWESET
jgi:hypothetical protein